MPNNPTTKQTGSVLTVRPLTPSDAAPWRNLLEASYGPIGRPPTWSTEEEFLALDQSLGLTDGERLIGGLRLIPLPVIYGARTIKAAGVAMANVHPDYRRRGYFSFMVRQVLGSMRERKYALSVLYPFDYGFYAKLGWAHAHDTVHYELPMGRLPPLGDPGGVANGSGGLAGGRPCPGQVRTVGRCRLGEKEEFEDGTVEALDEVYRRYALGYNGLAARDENAWRRVMRASPWSGDSIKLTSIWRDAAGRPGGYVVWVLPPMAKEDEGIRLREFVATSVDAYRGLLGFLRSQDAQFPLVKLSLPPSDPLPMFLASPEVKRELKPGSMLRIVDVATALREAADPPAGFEGAVVLSVEDPVCVWNRGDWLVSARCGVVAVEPVRSDDPRQGSDGGLPVSSGRIPASHAGSPTPFAGLDIGTLAQIVSGFLKAGTAWRAGKLRAAEAGAGSGAAAAFLDTVYGTRASYLSDYF